MRNEFIIDDRIHSKEIDKLMHLPVSVTLAGGFDEELGAAFRSALATAEQRALTSKQGILPIIIDSYGGDVYALNACVDAIKAVDPRLKIATICIGKAMSAGAILFTCGHNGYRYMTKNATLMFHGVRGEIGGTLEDIKVEAEEMQLLHNEMLKVASKNIGKKEKFFEELVKKNRDKDYFFRAEEAIALNIANKIGLPKFKIQLSYDIKFLDS